ncbi:MAG: hypothetical protein EOP84_12770 [Verrucomicrobiaceae bacterium]|nr:MAG: hypothetical protein EOP84_12770 [Verrucomicrobiaceae bacterium]
MSSHPHAHSPQEHLDSALQVLRDNQHRITAPRKALLGVLTNEHGPFTAEELHGRLEKGMCDLVTVYRCLAAMEEINIVRRCDFGDGVYRYEYNTGELVFMICFQFIIKILIQLLTQEVYIHIYHICFGIEVNIPNIQCYIGTRHYPVLIPYEVFQQLEFLGR